MCLCPCVLLFLCLGSVAHNSLCVCVCAHLPWTVELQNFSPHLAPLIHSLILFEVFPSLSLAIVLFVLGIFDVIQVWSCCFSFLVCLLRSLNARPKN